MVVSQEAVVNTWTHCGIRTSRIRVNRRCNFINELRKFRDATRGLNPRSYTLEDISQATRPPRHSALSNFTNEKVTVKSAEMSVKIT